MVLELAIADLLAPEPPARPTVQEALTRFWPGFAAGRSVEEQSFLVLWRLRACRTPRLGGYKFSCDGCGYTTHLFQSCRDRHCPTCGGPRRHAWAEKMSRLMLPVPQYQVVFTLPDVLWPIMARFPREVYDVLLKAASETVLDVAAQRWRATPSVLSVLHTWNRKLEFYPHVHCVVSAGGLRDDGTWYAHGTKFLFDRKTLGRRFRGKFLSKLAALGLKLTPAELGELKAARSRSMLTDWYTYVEAPEGRPSEHMLRYLAQYVHGIAISDHRMLGMDEATVTFRVRGEETLTLRGAEFVRRFALHVLPKGFRKTRMSGLLASGSRGRLELARQQILGMPEPVVPEEAPVADEDDAEDVEVEDEPVEFFVAALRCCPCCGRRWSPVWVPPDPAHARGPP